MLSGLTDLKSSSMETNRNQDILRNCNEMLWIGYPPSSSGIITMIPKVYDPRCI